MPKSGTFEEGFVDGWKLIAGARAAVPAIPPQPVIAADKTSYEIGVWLGMEAAKRRKGIE
jgi:hypothetical protein